MNDLRTQVSAAWRQAAAELGIRFTSPYSLTSEKGNRIDCLGLVHGFGAAFGTIVFVLGEDVPAKDLGDEYHCSELTASYAKYDRKLFVATLDDWGWRGPQAQTPSWYTGKAWANAG
jgi:hypothetical protein